jgi:hypothetical protein
MKILAFQDCRFDYLLSYSKGGFVPYAFPKIYKGALKETEYKRTHYRVR